MAVQSKLPIVPASFFGIGPGIAGLGSARRAAHRVWAATVGPVNAWKWMPRPAGTLLTGSRQARSGSPRIVI